MSMFAWGAQVYFENYRPPKNAKEIYVVGKQWMWKIQHSTGQREINELHVPAGRKVKLIMTAEDTIHDFFVPAFRIKADVLPGKYTTQWFEATKPGTYHLFCAEYCGMNHSGMIGSVIVMQPTEFDSWLSGNAGQQSPAVAGSSFTNPSVVFRVMARMAKVAEERRWLDCLAASVSNKRTNADGGRRLYSRVDRESAGKAGCRVWSNHAHVSGSSHSGAIESNHGIY